MRAHVLFAGCEWHPRCGRSCSVFYLLDARGAHVVAAVARCSICWMRVAPTLWPQLLGVLFAGCEWRPRCGRSCSVFYLLDASGAGNEKPLKGAGAGASVRPAVIAHVLTVDMVCQSWRSLSRR